MRVCASPTIRCWASKPAGDEIVEKNAAACCAAGEVGGLVDKSVDSKSEENPGDKHDIVVEVAVAVEPEQWENSQQSHMTTPVKEQVILSVPFASLSCRLP